VYIYIYIYIYICIHVIYSDIIIKPSPDTLSSRRAIERKKPLYRRSSATHRRGMDVVGEHRGGPLRTRGISTAGTAQSCHPLVCSEAVVDSAQIAR